MVLFGREPQWWQTRSEDAAFDRQDQPPPTAPATALAPRGEHPRLATAADNASSLACDAVAPEPAAHDTGCACSACAMPGIVGLETDSPGSAGEALPWQAVPGLFDPEQAVIASSVTLSQIPDSGIGIAYGDTFKLHSNPGSRYIVYLDFDGHTTTNTSWNSYWGTPTINSPAFSLDSSSSFTASELLAIQRIWQRVAEYFSPFNINVTTQDPGVEALRYSGASDNAFGVRVVITDEGGKNFGGIAYNGSFDWSSDTPVFIYANRLADGVKPIADATAHEVGHSLGLGHDGVIVNGKRNDYYYGHGSGATDWAPVMGVGYNANIVQWSKGEYTGATNLQDDLAVITSQNNGVAFRADDWGNTFATAGHLGGTEAEGVVTVRTFGVISGSGSRNDVDMFRFEVAAGGSLDLTVSSWSRAYVAGSSNPIFSASPFSMMDVSLTLHDSAGRVLQTVNDPAALGARMTATGLAGGTYFLAIDGVGFGNPLASSPTGYTEYGSLGQYMVTGSYVRSAPPPSAPEPEPPPPPPPPAPVFRLTLASNAVAEGTGTGNGGVLAFTVTRDAASDLGAATVTVSVAGSGTNPIDGNDLVGGLNPVAVVFAAGQTAAQFSLRAVADNLVEPNEGLRVTLAATTLGTVDATPVTATIVNDDQPPPPPPAPVFRLTLASNAVAEGTGTGNGGVLAFTVTRDAASDLGAATVTVTIAGSGTNPIDGNDLVGGLNPVAVVFAAGQTSAQFSLRAVADDLVEPDEGLRVTLAATTLGTVNTTPVTATIVNDDQPPPPVDEEEPPPPPPPPPAPVFHLALAANAVAEGTGTGNGGALVFTVTRDAGSDLGAATVTVVVAGDGADPIDDDDLVSGFNPVAVVFAAGQTSAQFSLQAVADDLLEPDEGLSVTLSSTTLGTVNATPVTATIVNDDQPPPPPDDEEEPPPPPLSGTPALSVDRAALITAEGETQSLVLRATDVSSEVVVTISGLNAAQGQLSATSLVLNAANGWSSSLAVTGIDDRDVDGDARYTLTFAAEGLSPVAVAVTHLDDDISATSGGAIFGTYVTAPTTFNATIRAQAVDDGSFFSSFREGFTADGAGIDLRWRFENLTPGDKVLQADARTTSELFRFEYSTDDGTSWERFADGPDSATRWNGNFLAQDVGETLWVRLIDVNVAGDTTRDGFSIDLLTVTNAPVSPTDALF